MKLIPIGQLARKAGVSARALRLYEQRGLLKPSSHSATGYRLYGPEAVERLLQISLLRSGGFSLSEIETLMHDTSVPVGSLLRHRMAALERELAERGAMLARLRRITEGLASTSSLTFDELMEQIRMTQTLKIGFTDAEKADLQARAAALGEPGLADAAQQWKQLIAAVQAHMDAGTSPDAPAMQALAAQWQALVKAFTAGNSAIASKLNQAMHEQPEAMASHGLSPGMFRYVGAAMRGLGADSRAL